MVRVDSEAMTDIDYDPDTRTLRIRFADGDWYSYSGVPAAVHRAFLDADSHGRFFQTHIRDQYRYRRGR